MPRQPPFERTAKFFILATSDPTYDDEEDNIETHTIAYPSGKNLCSHGAEMIFFRQMTQYAPGLDAVDSMILKNSIHYMEK